MNTGTAQIPPIQNTKAPPEPDSHAIAPEGIAVMPHGQTAPRQAFAGNFPGTDEVAGQLPWGNISRNSPPSERSPRHTACRPGHGEYKRAPWRTADRRHGGKQEFADPALSQVVRR